MESDQSETRDSTQVSSSKYLLNPQRLHRPHNASKAASDNAADSGARGRGRDAQRAGMIGARTRAGGTRSAARRLTQCLAPPRKQRPGANLCGAAGGRAVLAPLEQQTEQADKGHGPRVRAVGKQCSSVGISCVDLRPMGSAPNNARCFHRADFCSVSSSNLHSILNKTNELWPSFCFIYIK